MQYILGGVEIHTNNDNVTITDNENDYRQYQRAVDKTLVSDIPTNYKKLNKQFKWNVCITADYRNDFLTLRDNNTDLTYMEIDDDLNKTDYTVRITELSKGDVFVSVYDGFSFTIEEV